MKLKNELKNEKQINFILEDHVCIVFSCIMVSYLFRKKFQGKEFFCISVK